MKRLERAKKVYGGGGGKGGFESDLFSVTVWDLQYGVKTELTIKALNRSIDFDGEIEFKTDEDCMQQLTGEELLTIISESWKEGFNEGEEAKAQEFRKCLGVRGKYET